MRVVVADSMEVYRIGLRTLLAAEADVDLVGDTSVAEEVLPLVRACAPDVALVDAALGGGVGIQVVRAMREAVPATHVLVLSHDADDAALFASIDAGADGFLLKGTASQDLLRALRQVAVGRSLLDPAVTAAVLHRLREAPKPPIDARLAKLSARELEVLGLVSEGRSNLEIAQRLSVSEKTVKNHLTSIMSKLRVSRRGEATAYYLGAIRGR